MVSFVLFEKEKPNGVVRLVEANGFYGAYNHNAYLFHQAIAQHKVTKKFIKNVNQELMCTGFPVDKLLERIGTRIQIRGSCKIFVNSVGQCVPTPPRRDDVIVSYRCYDLN